MKIHFQILLIFILISGLITASPSQSYSGEHKPRSQGVWMQVDGNDTIYLAFLKDIYVYPKLKFNSKKQEEFYWRTVRDVKKALPYAKIVSSELNRVNLLISKMPKQSDQKKYLAKYEKEVFNKYEPDLRKLSFNQGRLLLKLIDRECNSTSYDLIKTYRGSVSAFFWQGVARIFGSNLKSEYDASGNDKIIERVIILVESGQL
ncbi:MAG: DUF4294 domain-containing protein [Paludibacter sp.]|nr:DUF4294 domain-containing protein [Paludibacter sp.]